MNWDDTISEEEARRILKDLGVPTDTWQNTSPSGDVEIKTLPSFARMAAALGKIKGQIESAIEQDKQQVQELHEKELRIKHGGGR